MPVHYVEQLLDPQNRLWKPLELWKTTKHVFHEFQLYSTALTTNSSASPKPRSKSSPIRPSYNIAALKCQIDAAHLPSSVSHVPHIPSNRTPAIRV